MHVIVVGLDSMPGLQTARIFARRGVSVVAIARDPQHYACGTKVCEKIHYGPTSGPKLIALLEQLSFNTSSKPLLVPCIDSSVWTISEHREILKDSYHFALPSDEVVKLLMDKVCFYKFAETKKLSIPKTYFLKSRVDAEAAARELNFPYVLKPSQRGRLWHEHIDEKAIRVDSVTEFIAAYDRCAPFTDTLIAQKWVEGPDSNLYSCNCYFGREGQPLATFVARKLRQWPPSAGFSCLGEEIRADEVLNETIKLFEFTGYHGLGYVEMKKDSVDGRYYIIEPNIGRPTGRSAIAEAGGVEMLFTMYCDIFGLSLPSNRKQNYSGVKWVHLLRDLQSAFYYFRKGELTISEWFHSIRGRKAYAVFDLRDRGPILRELRQGFPSLMSSRRKRKWWSQKEPVS